MKKTILLIIALPMLMLCGCENEREYTAIKDPSILIGTWQCTKQKNWTMTFDGSCWHSTDLFSSGTYDTCWLTPFICNYEIVDTLIYMYNAKLGVLCVPCDCDSFPSLAYDDSECEILDHSVKYNGKYLYFRKFWKGSVHNHQAYKNPKFIKIK